MQEEWRPDEEANRGFNLKHSLLNLARRPVVVLLLLIVWSVLALLSQIFVNGGLFLDIHDQELDGALGGLALSFNALPLAMVYVYSLRSPSTQVFWLAMLHQGSMAAAGFYHWAIGTFTFESVVALIVASGTLTVLSFLQIFEPRKTPSPVGDES